MDGGAETHHLERITLLSPSRPFDVMHLTIRADIPQGRGCVVHGPPIAKEVPEAQKGRDVVPSLDPALIVVTRGGAGKRVKGGLSSCSIESIDNVNFQDGVLVAI